MIKLILLNYVILPLVSSVEWELVVDDLNAATFGLGSWQFKNACPGGGGGGTTGSVGACQTNSNSYIQIQDNIFRTYKTYANDIPHYEVRVLTDFYIQGSSGGGQTLTIYLENTAVSSFSYTSTTLLDYNPVCVTSNSTNFQIRTYIVEATHTNNQNILIQYCTSINNSGKWVGIRNLQIYIHRCYYTCSQCDGPTQNDCTNCYYSGSGPTCQPCSTSTTGNRFTDYTVNLNCQSECDRNGKLADSNYVCQAEPRISQQGTYFTGSFTSYSDPPWKFIADPLFFDPTVPTSKVSICSSTKFMGFFRFNEAMEFTFTLATQVQYIRLRVTFYMANWQDNTSIQVLMDEIPMVVIKSVSGVIQLTNAIKISSGTCGSYTTYRIEAIILKTSNSPKLKLKGNMDVTTTQSWGFSEFYIDVAVCQINCSVCKNSEECYTCSATYRVYKGTCVQTCPPYSQSSTNAQGNVCIDYDEETAQSQFLLKAFYDTTTTDDEVIALVGTVSTTGSPNFQTNGYYWSYIPGKRVLGGSLVWYKAKFVKSFTIPDPHYLVRVRMKVILGDGMTGNFYYQFYNLSNVTVTTTNVGTTSNLWGKAANEKTIPLDFPVQHDDITPSSFSVTLHCQSVATNIYDGFCAVSDYFLVVHYCAPYCNACIGPNPADCTSQQSLPANLLTFDPLKCNNNYFLDKSVLPYICTQCATGCQECTSTTVCTTCKTNFSLIANTCYCNQGLFLSGTICQNCNSICQNCYGANANQCLGCYPIHYRYLSKNVCLCNPYYYDDGFNTACLPICGDLIVVEGEACDDGNDIPYDGCHNCQYSYQLECKDGVSGRCVKCIPGWQLNKQTKKCQPICGDLQIAGNEECEDGNITPFDGCYQCKYQCDARCTSCIYGKCQSCDSGNGWILNQSLSICESQCSDLIVAKTEYCDDSNIPPFDGCFACAYSCPIECSVCTLGQCQQCISGYTFNTQLKTCSMICGDAVQLPNEVCDDGNQIPYDGCYRCQYSCQPECTNCVQGICTACDTHGWEINNNTCWPTCGDGITLQIEQCDDGNFTPFDGCYQCKESCQNECLNCHQGQCLMCISTFYLNNFDYQCYSKCGDILVVSNEECDDGNNIDFDGCSNCKNQCQPTCTGCVGGICQECNTNGYYLNSYQKCESICGDTLIANDEECDDGNNEQFDGCFQCKWQCQYECLTCGRGICTICKDGYHLEGQICSNICGDSVISKGEQCDDGNYLQFDGCFNCKYEFQMKCSQNCISCEDLSHCLQCNAGYQLNYFTADCSPLCIDLITTQNQECEVGNHYLGDGHNQYQFQCQDGCQFCSIGGCLKCEDGWVLNEVDFSCFTICGDGVVGGLELCDDGNNDMLLNGCLECIYECQLESLVCETSNCYLATNQVVAAHSCSIFQSCDSTTGIYLDQFENTCNSHCGDSIIALEEQCDDGNAIPYDGCDNCLFSCDFLCQDCLLGICVKCQTGYQVIEKKCKGVCGDGIILPELEECDDSNSIPRDGCTACKIDPNHGCSLTESGVSLCYSCPKNCQFCDQLECKQCKSSYFMNQGLCVKCSNKCEECEGNPNNCISCMFEECNLCESKAGYYSNLEEKSCYSKCGDNVVSKGEQCDDGNNVSNDGCNSQCQLEGRFQCGDFGCEEIPLPAISLQYRNSTTTNVILFQIEDNFTSGYCEKLTVMIELFQQSEFNISVTEEISKNSCEFVFTFHKTIEKENLIHFKIPPTDGQRRQLSEIKREIIIKPRKQVYYTDSEISQAQSVLQAQEYLNLILKLIGPMTIVLGGFNFFWTILDIFSWINNFYFINVEYPENVRVFFQHLEWGDLFMIPSINIMNSEEDEYYFEAPPKFVEKDVDPLFLNNIQLFVYLVGLSFFAYFLAGRVLILINKIYPVKRKSKILSFYNLENNFTTHRKVKLFNQKRIPIIITRLRQECQSYSNNYRAILMQIMGLVFLDLCLASFLQITNTSTQEYWIVKTNIIIAWVNLILIGYIFYLNYIVSNSHETLLKNKTFISIFGTLYEGINIESSIAKTYAFVNLIRKCLFIFFTVYYYEDPILQTSTCCLACFLNIALLCYQNPFESVQLLIQIGLPDFFIFSIILTTVCLAVDEQIKLFSNENKLIIGWVILSFIGISILIQLYFLMQVFYQNLQDRWHMIKDLICPEQAK